MVQQVGCTINNHHAFKGQITGDMLCRKLIRRKEPTRGDWPRCYPNFTGLWTLHIRRNCIQLTIRYISHSQPTNKFCSFWNALCNRKSGYCLGSASDRTVDRSIPVFHVELLRCPKLPDIWKRIAMFEGAQAPPACPSDKSNKKVKESRNRPGVAQRIPGGLGSQISWHSACEGGEVVSLTHWPPLPPGNFPGTHFH